MKKITGFFLKLRGDKPIVTPESILDQYQKLESTPSGHRHAEEYHKLQTMVRNHRDQLYELIFSGKVKEEKDLHCLIFFGGHGGSVGKEHNKHWIPFLMQVRERQGELPESIRHHFEWLGRVHHYWEDAKPTEVCIQLLNDIILTDGVFDYQSAMDRLNEMKSGGRLNALEYVNLVDATNHRNTNGDYRDSLIYKRAEAEETR